MAYKVGERQSDKMVKNLKIAVIQKFDSQADFALAVKAHESKVSQVIRGRRKLTPEEAEVWRQALECDSSILELVTKDACEI